MRQGARGWLLERLETIEKIQCERKWVAYSFGLTCALLIAFMLMFSVSAYMKQKVYMDIAEMLFMASVLSMLINMFLWGLYSDVNKK